MDNQDDNDPFVNGKYQQDKLIDNDDYLKLSNYNNKDEISFINYSHSYSVCIISTVNFAQEIDKLKSAEEIRKYYSTFFDTMIPIILRYGGKVVKNIEDILLFYFPKTVNFSKSSVLKDVLDCGLAMIDARSELNSKLCEFGLPPISYRISANYGRVELATTTNSYNVDLFGPTVNICSKINHLALPNQMVIYKDLYDVIEKTEFFKDYRFNKVKNDKYFASLHSIYSVNYYVSPSLVVAASNTDTTASSNKRNMHIVIEDKQQNKKQKKPLQQHHQEFDIETKTIIKKQKDNAWTDLMAKNKGQEEISNSSFNILIIDDDKDILFTFASIMEMEGFKTTSISNPIKALNYFSQIDPYYYDLIIMDIRMPGLNGLQLYFKLKVMNPELKVLFLSALDAIEEILTIFPEVKSSQIIRKPVESKDLLSKINTILKS